ncbi:MAG: hypothetical protein JXB14_00345 [Candidatus Altiarchaeota archaeon]|nr:hypothetical protein [Candidatus Altiarchaeota archaeon]
MTLDKRIKKISETSGLAEDEVKAIIEKKKEDAAGLLTDHGAIYALEKEYGIDSASADDTPIKYIKLSDLKADSNNINVIGRIKEVRPIKKFKTDKRVGQFSRVLIVDDTAEKNIVLWDKSADIAESEKLQPGMTMVLRNAYTREGLNKEPEIHVGGLSRLIIDPKNVDPKLIKKLPKVSEELKKIAEVKENDITSVLGRAIYLYPKSEFDRSDGTKGQRSSMIIEDETGKLRVVLWDFNANKIEGFSEGDVVKVENGQVRLGNRGTEIHLGNRGRIFKSSTKLDLPKIEARTYKLGSVQPDLQNVDVIGRVMRLLPVKEFVSGERTGKLASAVIADDTGVLRVVLWGEKAELIKEINHGDIILLRNGYTKQSLNGEAEVHLSQRGTLHINPENIDIPKVEVLLEKHAKEKSISELEPNDRSVKITGAIKEVDETPMVFEICSECGSRIENVAGEWICDVCGETKPSYSMVVGLEVEDKTGAIRTIFFRDLAEQLTGMNVTDVLNLIGQSGDETEPVRQLKNELIGKKISLIGNIRYNDYFDRLELTTTSISTLTSASSASKKPSKKAKREVVEEEIIGDVPGDSEEFDIEEIDLDK